MMQEKIAKTKKTRKVRKRSNPVEGENYFLLQKYYFEVRTIGIIFWWEVQNRFQTWSGGIFYENHIRNSLDFFITYVCINDQQKARLKALGFCIDARLNPKSLPAHPAFPMAKMI